MHLEALRLIVILYNIKPNLKYRSYMEVTRRNLFGTLSIDVLQVSIVDHLIVISISPQSSVLLATSTKGVWSHYML